MTSPALQISISYIKMLNGASLRNTHSSAGLHTIISIIFTHRIILLPGVAPPLLSFERWRLISTSTVQPYLQYSPYFLPTCPKSNRSCTDHYSGILRTVSPVCKPGNAIAGEHLYNTISFSDEQSLLFNLHPLGSRAATTHVTTSAVILRFSDSHFSPLAIVKLLECCMEYPHNNPHVRKDKGGGKSRIRVCEPGFVEMIRD